MLIENEILKNVSGIFERNPKQLNGFLESDAEIILLNNGKSLAITYDGIVEEIAFGIYEDPYLMGWMSVVVSMSDLCAVGAEPLGVLLSQNIPGNYPRDKMDEIQRGVADACQKHQTYVLGGDSNTSSEIHLGSTAVGIIEDSIIISRKGCMPQDHLFATGKLGSGMGFAFERLFLKSDDIEFQPIIHLEFGRLVRKYGTACIDTSDGFFPAICNLMEINEVGFNIHCHLSDLLQSLPKEIAEQNSIPSWIFLAGPHGEFELLFTIPDENLSAFLNEATKINWKPEKIGKTIEKTQLLYAHNKNGVQIDGFRIANLFKASGNDPERYLNELLKLDQKWQLI